MRFSKPPQNMGAGVSQSNVLPVKLQPSRAGTVDDCTVLERRSVAGMI